MAVGFDPIPRKELYLDVITGGDSELPEPLTREEKYLGKIAGMSVDIPEPLTRYEQYLYAIANGDTLTLNPIPRLEMYLAKACGQDIDVPEPITREEKYWFDYINGGRWEVIEYTGAVPVEILAAGEPLIDYLISGNMSQTGTPSPTTPIQPQECGERTGNLLDFNELKTAPSGVIPGGNTFTFEHLLAIKAAPNTKYTMSATGTGAEYGDANVNRSLYFGSVDNSRTVFSGHDVTYTTSSDGMLYVGFISSRDNAQQYLNGTAVTAINIGSTALPYEPNGYKLDVSSGGENLSQWEKGGISTTTGADEAYRTATQGGTCEQLRSLYIPCNGNADYVLHTNHYPVQTFISYYDADKNYISRSSGTPQGENRVFTTPGTARYMRAQLAHVVTGQVYPAIEENQQYAITLGSTAKPYSPYNRITTPIYLGEVETERKVKKLAFDGTEDWHVTSGIFYLDSINPDYMRAAGEVTHMCSHFPASKQVSSAAYVETNTLAFGSSIYSQRVYCTYTGVSTVVDFKAYLSAQYAAGTPVCVWYVLAEPTTGIVNEPIRKIGTYADTLSMEQAGVSIPTIEGSNVIDVLTTLKPSEVYIKYKGRSSS